MHDDARSPEQLSEALSTKLTTRALGRSIEWHDEVTSTNDLIADELKNYGRHGHVIVAESQSKGRGARGADWTSPPGTDLYVSFALTEYLSLSALPLLPLAVGLGLAECAEALTGERALVKWPNDTLLAGGKCAGVLIESSTRGEEVSGVTVGFGLNVNRTLFDGLPDATSLAKVAGHPFDRAEVLAKALSYIEDRVDQALDDEPTTLVLGVDTRLAWRGEEVECGDVQGKLLGLRADGALRVEVGVNDVKALVAGRLRRAT